MWWLPDARRGLMASVLTGEYLNCTDSLYSLPGGPVSGDEEGSEDLCLSERSPGVLTLTSLPSTSLAGRYGDTTFMGRDLHCLLPGLLSHVTVHIWGWNSLLGGAGLCALRCLAPSLAIPLDSMTPPFQPPRQPKLSPDIASFFLGGKLTLV